ncbi:MAG TPA: lipid-A-disaccharide synthase [Acidobacteriaceae bacterium]|nr:lipid-A-disaccharide synthase [Acidobacteriaceae bacterium]
MNDANHNPRIFLSAGEASGDHYGAAIITELQARIPSATFIGLGGTAMEAAGQHRIVRAEDVAHMGITEVLRHAPFIFTQYRKLVASLKRDRPALAILIDFPDVNFRLAKHCKRLGIPVLWFVSPQLWAWKRRRLRWVQQRVDRMLVIFPFEQAFYRNRQVNAEFVGHPLATLPVPTCTREQFAIAHMASNPSASKPSSHLDRPWIALLPGSRWKEVTANLPTMLEAAALLGPGYDILIPVANTLKLEEVTRQIFDQILPRIQWPSGSSVTLVPEARAALHHARASIVASGTATVQALTIGNPFVVVYRVSQLTFAIAKRLIRYPAEIGDEATLQDADGNLPIGMPNLIAGRRIVPELLNQRFTAQNLAAALRPLLEDTPARTRMIADLAETRARLQPDPTSNPIHRVCDTALELLHSNSDGNPPSASNQQHPKQ